MKVHIFVLTNLIYGGIMQQLYLTGTHAAELADRLFTALNIRPAGYRLQPFAVEGALRGDAMHLLLPPGEAHAYINTHSTWLYNCMFLPSALAMYSAEEQSSMLFKSSARAKTDPAHRQEVALLLERIIMEQQTQKKSWERMITVLFTELMVHFERSLSVSPHMDSSSAHHRVLMRVMSYIEENYHRELSLDELAREADMSPSHLTRQFKMTTGMAPVEYCRSFRIAKSGELLKSPGATVTEVASAMGFSDISVFSRQFKQVTGMSPTEYRRQL